ncbi:retroviral-like aspartic protease family protein [Anaerolineales bacterium HSG25]|nr:retroviral-like aspartic protease family protein [Anaerolineales bacterium HSG25]
MTTNKDWSHVPMLIDTGADITLVPHQTIKQLGLIVAQDKNYELADFNGNLSVATMVELALIFCNCTFRGQFLLVEQDMGILGRNVLNTMPLLFNGPQFKWSVHR